MCTLHSVLYTRVFPFPPPQCKVLEEGIALHAQVCPDSMRALHVRMEELMKDYSARYGSHGFVGGGDYDPVTFLQQDRPTRKRMSSSRRREHSAASQFLHLEHTNLLVLSLIA